jgi:hypothetical protein
MPRVLRSRYVRTPCRYSHPERWIPISPVRLDKDYPQPSKPGSYQCVVIAIAFNHALALKSSRTQKHAHAHAPLEAFSLLETFSFAHFARNRFTARGVLISSYYTHSCVPSLSITYLNHDTALTTAHVALSTDGSFYEHQSISN